MNEADLNTIIGRSLPWHFKPKDGTRQLLPFDGFGIYDGKPLYWEAKFLKKPQSFNFHRLEVHQIANLLEVREHLKGNCHSLFLIGVDFGWADKRVFIFRDLEYIDKRKKEKKNILKKEFLIRKNYVKIKKRLINFEELLNLPKEWEYV